MVRLRVEYEILHCVPVERKTSALPFSSKSATSRLVCCDEPTVTQRLHPPRLWGE